MNIADELMRELYRPHRKSSLPMLDRDRPGLRTRLANAKRMVLDASMSEFLAQLATVPFKVRRERRPDALTSLRHTAIPPFKNIFLEVDGRAFRKGLLATAEHTRDVWGAALIAPEDSQLVANTGYELEHLEELEVVLAHTFFMLDGKLHCLPFSWIWAYGDYNLGHESYRKQLGDMVPDVISGMFAHGITHYVDPSIGVLYHPGFLQAIGNQGWVDIQNEQGESWGKVHKLVMEFGGTVRYLLAFLATLNHVPHTQAMTRERGSYLGGGQMRKYLTHDVLTLRLPARTTNERLAKRLIAQARRGWHEVRPHWRRQNKPGGTFCGSEWDHTWTERDSTGHSYCTKCDAKQVWITLPTGRGDPTIRVKTKQYRVTHGV